VQWAEFHGLLLSCVPVNFSDEKARLATRRNVK
jgi:hypothetical protein